MADVDANDLIGDSDSENTTHSLGSLECIPAWETASVSWGVGWQIHTFGAFITFSVLCVYSFVCLLFLCKRWKLYRFLALALTMTLLVGLLRGVYYVVDPYSYAGKVPSMVNRLLQHLANPALSAAFGSTQRQILSLTRLDVGGNRIENNYFFGAAVVLHFVITLAVEITISNNYELKPLLLLSHGYFIIWTTFLSMSFIYNGFKLTHYTSETQKALKGFPSGDGGLCESLQKPGVHVTQRRRLRPRIKITNEDTNTCSLITESDTSDSDTPVSARRTASRAYVSNNRPCDRAAGVSLSYVDNAVYQGDDMYDGDSDSSVDNKTKSKDSRPRVSTFSAISKDCGDVYIQQTDC